jgi:riboflavin synthase
MFTGIIEELGEVVDWHPTKDAARLTVRAPLAVSDAAHGDSISVNGVCLTVVDQGEDWFTADVMAETIRMSTLRNPKPGDRVNLERAAKVGDRLGGHIVQGHIDGTAEVLSIAEGSAWRVVRFRLAPELARLVVRKGSIALDGVSLTVSAVGRDADAGTEPGRDWFEVSLIPETLAVTTLGLRQPGDLVNVETDILARHVERLVSIRGSADASPLLNQRGQTDPVTSRGDVGSEVAGSRAGAMAIAQHSRDASADEAALRRAAGIFGHDPETPLLETLAVTTLGLRQPGDLVNVETDILARHVQRLLEVTSLGQRSFGVAGSRAGAMAIAQQSRDASADEAALRRASGIFGHDPETPLPETHADERSGS